MRVSVYFHNERRLWAIEINDVRSDGVLPTKPKAAKLAIAQV